MGLLSIQDKRLAGVTLLPDDFIDYYMPRANGEFVKIYLYLLRCTHLRDADPSLSSLADVFSCTEKDIVRALRYWEKAGILSLKFHGRERELERVELLPISSSLHATQQDPGEEVDPYSGESSTSGTDAGHAQSKTASGQSGSSEKPAKPKPSVMQITSGRMKQLGQDEVVKQILFVTQAYIGHPLSTTDMRRILYFYDELHFPADLIDYLVEYCVSRGGRSLDYIEKVGLAWNDEGLTTLAAAREYNAVSRNNYYTIFKAFGIRSRSPIPDEIATMQHWMNEYGFDLKLISEAASRTVKQTGKPSFPYAERILSDWHKAGVHTLDDVAKLDAEHQSRRNQAPAGNAGQAASTGSTGAKQGGNSTKFNENFHQRDYDFRQLEQELLRNQQRPE
uniref:DnaD domain protein n=1 Tax=Eubacterium cellulosolvens TaxID=29322 RepID=UPI000484E3F6|nr:DnaD domain protein [[Eubacterium] cellulosolvens]